MSRNLFLIRALPGAGKSTIAEIVAPNSNISADEYFDQYNSGEFDHTLLSEAHDWCKSQCEKFMTKDHGVVAVHNTFTTEWEMKAYVGLAAQYGYRVHTLIVENRHGSSSVHNVPDATVQKMRDRFDIKL